MNGEGGFFCIMRQIGMAKPVRIDSTVTVTTRHNESAPSASEAATASISREEATGALRLPKPAAAGERVMAGIPGRQKSSANRQHPRNHRRQDCGDFRVENGGFAARVKPC
jgi:hypothetical protein